MVEGLRQIRERIKETEREIEELCKEFAEYEYLLTIPGFGPDVSSKVLGAIGDADRFENGRQVLKLAGLDLGANRSGKESEKAVPEISKRGEGGSSVWVVSSSVDWIDEGPGHKDLLYETA
jgi:transposase